MHSTSFPDNLEGPPQFIELCQMSSSAYSHKADPEVAAMSRSEGIEDVIKVPGRWTLKGGGEGSIIKPVSYVESSNSR